MIGRIYKIYSTESKENDVYIGSTLNNLNERFSDHIQDYKKWKNDKKKYKYITSFYLFDEYGSTSCVIELIKEYEIIDDIHLRAYEQLWIEKYKFNKFKVVNKNNPFYIKYLYMKEYRRMQVENDPDFHKKKYQRKLELHPDYHQKHYQRRLELYPDLTKKIYQRRLELNPDYNQKRYQKQREKIVCDCGTQVSRGSLYLHKKSKKHNDLLNADKK